MKSLALNRIRELEVKAKELGLDERILIENASSNLFKVVDSLNLGKRALIISGRGNNGADVLSCARKLASAGYDVVIVVLEDKELGPEAYFQKNLLVKIGCQLHSLKSDNVFKLKEFFRNRDFILEGILGTGAKGEVSPFLREAIDLINESGKKIISCDIPSGLSPDEGAVLGRAIRADYTVTFIAPKSGFYLNQGPNLCGKISVVDIGISRDILEKVSGAREGT